MFLAIRLLALIAFTGHSVLGCCVSHGSCTREQSPAIATAPTTCCDHSNPFCGEDNRRQVAQANILESTSSTDCDPTDPGHSSHCEHIHCVFGLNVGTGYFANWFCSPWIVWDRAFFDLKLGTAHVFSVANSSLHRPPQDLCSRAILQVWLI
jgi:hypothetical protein